MKQYWNKLVRDGVPGELASRGIKVEFKTLPGEVYAAELDKKLTEESQEFTADHSLAELADVLEVVYAQADHYGFSLKELESYRKNKAAKRGGFEARLYLISTDE